MKQRGHEPEGWRGDAATIVCATVAAALVGAMVLHWALVLLGR